ncbi:unnamed protein product [Boreogadus saida]
MTHPKEEDSEEWLGATAAQHRHPVAVGGVAGSAAILLDLAPADQQDLQALTLALERRFGQRRVVSHSRELLTSRRRREGERLGAYAADDLPRRGLGQHVRLAAPPNLDVALELAERAERELSDLQPSGAPRPHVRQANYERDEGYKEECFQAWTSPQRPRQRPPQRPPSDDRGGAGPRVSDGGGSQGPPRLTKTIGAAAGPRLGGERGTMGNAKTLHRLRGAVLLAGL